MAAWQAGTATHASSSGSHPRRPRLRLLLAVAVAGAAAVASASASASSHTFTVGAPMATKNVTQGASVTFDIALFASGGFSDPVSLSVSGLPAGASASFSPNPANPVSGGPAATLTVSTDATTPTGIHNLTVTGTSGSLASSTGLTLVVDAAPSGGGSFTLGAPLASQPVTQGASVSYDITIFASGGFGDPVSLSVSGLPTGATASFSPNPATPVSGGPSSTLTVSTDPSTPVGSHNLTVAGTSGSITQTTGLTLVVNPGGGGGGGSSASFTLGSPLATQNVDPGNSVSYSVTVVPSGGFSSSVTLSVSGLPSGAGGSFSPNPASPVTGAPASTLTVSTSSSTPAGIYNLTVTGTSGSLTQTTGLTLVVNAAGGSSGSGGSGGPSGSGAPAAPSPPGGAAPPSGSPPQGSPPQGSPPQGGPGRPPGASAAPTRINGTKRADKIRGTSRSDTIRAGGGNDRIDVRGGGRDRVRCGAGRDVVLADPQDVVAKDCEVVIRRRRR